MQGYELISVSKHTVKLEVSPDDADFQVEEAWGNSSESVSVEGTGDHIRILQFCICSNKLIIPTPHRPPAPYH